MNSDFKLQGVHSTKTLKSWRKVSVDSYSPVHRWQVMLKQIHLKGRLSIWQKLKLARAQSNGLSMSSESYFSDRRSCNLGRLELLNILYGCESLV